MKRFMYNLYLTLVIVGTWLLALDALGFTKSTVIFDFELWKVLFVIMYVDYVFENINKILASYVGDSV